MRERQAARSMPGDVINKADAAQDDRSGSEAINEPCFTPADVARMLKISHDYARRLVRNEPRVIILPGPGGPGTRRYETIRIPRAVFEALLRGWRRGSTGS